MVRYGFPRFGMYGMSGRRTHTSVWSQRFEVDLLDADDDLVAPVMKLQGCVLMSGMLS